MRLFPLPGEAVLDGDTWFTPPGVFAALGLTFDLDPASPRGGVPWIPVDRYYTEDDDGLLQPWEGRVWLNPPYSKPAPWIERLKHHGDGLALIPADTATSWWHAHVIASDQVCFIRHRLRFIRGGDETSAMFPSAIAAWGGDNAAALRRSGLGWCP